MAEDVWKAGADGDRMGGGAPPGAVGSLPKVFDLLNLCINDLRQNFAGYLLAGLGLLVVILPMVILVYVGIFAAIVPGIVVGQTTGNDDLGGLVTVGGVFLGVFVMIFVMMVVMAPINGSLYRNVLASLRGEQPLGFGACFSRMFEDVGKVVLLMLIQGALTLVGVLLCYVPGLLVAMFLNFALPAVIVHKLGPMDAIGLSVRHVKANLSWHLGFWALGLAMMMISSNVPIVGLVGIPMYAAYQLRAYRQVFGDGEMPIET